MEQRTAIISLVFVAAYMGQSASWELNDVNWEQIADKYDLDFTDEELGSFKLGLAYPGTKWCGPSNIADNYEDLGTKADTDSCCRAHDNCPDVLKVGESRHNLTNIAPYSRLSCDCDEEFRQCLRNSGTSTSKNIGTIYFNVLGTKCFREDYPVIGCNEYSGVLNKKCIEPEYDTEGQKRYQWFDVPNY